MNCGFQIIGRPSMGSWLTYGLGSECADLPGFVVLLSGENQPDGGKSWLGSGFLPQAFINGVEFRSAGDPVLYLTNPEGVSADQRRASLDALKDLNELNLQTAGDPEVATRIASYRNGLRRCRPAFPDLGGYCQGAGAHSQSCTARNPARNRLLSTTPAGASEWWSAVCGLCSFYHRGCGDTRYGTSPNTDIVNRLPKLCQEIDQGVLAALVQDSETTRLAGFNARCLGRRIRDARP